MERIHKEFIKTSYKKDEMSSYLGKYTSPIVTQYLINKHAVKMIVFMSTFYLERSLENEAFICGTIICFNMALYL